MLKLSSEYSKKETDKILTNFNYFKNMLEKNSQHTTNLKNKIKQLGEKQSEEFEKDEKNILENLNNLKNKAEKLKKIEKKEGFVSIDRFNIFANQKNLNNPFISYLILALFLYFMLTILCFD